MMRFIRPRLRKPVGIALAGTLWQQRGLCTAAMGGKRRSWPR